MIKTKSIRGLKTSWIQKGLPGDESQILFFLHGCPDDPSTWSKQFDFFENKYCILAPFLRGLGKSEKSNRSRYTLNATALDHLEILRNANPKGNSKVTIIAHDIGAPYAWHLARLLGERLHSLIIIDGPELTQMARRAFNLSQLMKSWYIGVIQLPVVAKIFIKLQNKKFASAIHFIPYYRTLLREIPKELSQKNPPLQAPVLVMWGIHDPFLEIPTATEMKRLARNFTLRVLEGAHWIHLEKHDRVNSLIHKFLEKV